MHDYDILKLDTTSQEQLTTYLREPTENEVGQLVNMFEYIEYEIVYEVLKYHSQDDAVIILTNEEKVQSYRYKLVQKNLKSECIKYKVKDEYLKSIQKYLQSENKCIAKNAFDLLTLLNKNDKSDEYRNGTALINCIITDNVVSEEYNLKYIMSICMAEINEHTIIKWMQNFLTEIKGKTPLKCLIQILSNYRNTLKEPNSLYIGTVSYTHLHHICCSESKK